ncbi:MAG TPA: protein translocase subunit SecF [Myxococcota bacterium]|nr:protein translocase subunit SecF [Myxococcota bacterium]
MLEIVPPGTNFDFLGKRYIAIGVSLVVIFISIAAIPIVGIRMGIDFAGGTEVLLKFDPGSPAEEGIIRSLAESCGIQGVTVVRYGEVNVPEFLLRFRAAASPSEAGETSCPVREEDRARVAAVRAAMSGGGEQSTADIASTIDFLQSAFSNKIGGVTVERVEFVGPRVGEDLRRDGMLSIGVACLLILVYIGFRFSPRYAPGAVIALIHDVVITAGVFVVFGMEFDLSVLAALLAILGYSLNDTIIVYDRIREMTEQHTKHDLVDVLNRSVNQTLSRTLLTSGTTLLASASLVALGGEVIRPFALAMMIGIIVGTYSSIFIAAPTLLFLEERFGSAGSSKDQKSATRGSERPSSKKAARA